MINALEGPVIESPRCSNDHQKPLRDHEHVLGQNGGRGCDDCPCVGEIALDPWAQGQ
jgi:hypothetical protein